MKKKHLVFLLLSLMIASFSYAQTADQTTTVCPGSTTTYEVSSPGLLSTYQWVVKNASGTLSASSGTSVSVAWSVSSTVTDQISVTETNAAGCIGLPTVIVVNKYTLPTAVFEKTGVCNGEQLKVLFTGTSPFTIIITPANGMTVGYAGTQTSWIPSLNQPGVYQITEMTDENCAVKLSSAVPNTTATISAPLGKLTVKITPQ